MTSSKTLPKGQIRNVPAPQGNKQSIYSRFIPREELNDFAAWTPGTIESAGDSQEHPVRSQRAEEPAVAAPNPHDELQAMLQANRQQAYQDGYRDGLVALEAFKQSHARQLSAQMSPASTFGGRLGRAARKRQQQMMLTAAPSSRAARTRPRARKNSTFVGLGTRTRSSGQLFGV